MYRCFAEFFPLSSGETPIQSSTSNTNGDNQSNVESLQIVAASSRNRSSGNENLASLTKAPSKDNDVSLVHATKASPEYHHSIQRVKLELAVKKTSVDTVTVLQGALMKEGTVRPATDQGKLLLHTVYKVWGSIVENEVTNREKQAVLEAITSIPDEQLRDFRDGDKLIRVKQHSRKGISMEWDAEAAAWCDKAFNIIRHIYPLLKDVKEFHT